MAHAPTTRYVVLQWDRDSGSNEPDLAVDKLFTKLIDADDVAREMTGSAKRDNSSDDTFTVHEVNMDVVTY